MVRALLPQLHDCWEQLHPQQPGFTSNAVNNSFTKPGESLLQQLLWVCVHALQCHTCLALKLTTTQVKQLTIHLKEVDVACSEPLANCTAVCLPTIYKHVCIELSPTTSCCRMTRRLQAVVACTALHCIDHLIDHLSSTVYHAASLQPILCQLGVQGETQHVV